MESSDGPFATFIPGALGCRGGDESRELCGEAVGAVVSPWLTVAVICYRYVRKCWPLRCPAAQQRTTVVSRGAANTIDADVYESIRIVFAIVAYLKFAFSEVLQRLVKIDLLPLEGYPWVCRRVSLCDLRLS